MQSAVSGHRRRNRTGPGAGWHPTGAAALGSSVTSPVSESTASACSRGSLVTPGRMPGSDSIWIDGRPPAPGRSTHRASTPSSTMKRIQPSVHERSTFRRWIPRGAGARGLMVSDEAASIQRLIDKDQIIDLVHEYSYCVDHRLYD